MDSPLKEKNSTFTVSVESSKEDGTSSKKSFFHINKEMLRFKVLYFLSIGAMSLLPPYTIVFGTTRLGFTRTSIGALLTAQQFSVIFIRPVMGYLADYFNKLKAMTCALFVLYSLCAFFLLLIPPSSYHAGGITFENSDECTFTTSGELSNNFTTLDVKTFSTVLRNYNYAPQDFISNDSKMPCTIQRVLNLTLEGLSEKPPCFVRCEGSEESYHFPCQCLRNATADASGGSDLYTYQFWVFAVLIIATNGSVGTLITFIDTACCETVQKTKSDYGRQRVYGPIGWALMSVIGGLLFDWTQDYLASFVLIALLSLIAMWNVYNLDLVKPQFSKHVCKHFGTVLKSKNFLIFQGIVLMSGMGCAVNIFYISLFLTDIGASRFLCGFVHGFQSILEIPFLFFSGWLIEKAGHFNLMAVTLLAFFLRFFIYSFLQNAWLVLPVEILHGFSYAIVYPTLTSYAKMISKPGLEATSQGLVISNYRGLGTGLGCVLFGMGYDHFGGHQMYFYTSLFYGCGTVLVVLLKMCTKL